MRGDERGLGSGSREDRTRDVLDERIDAALRSYVEPGEVPEARVVLARVKERAREAESQQRGWWVWGAVAAGLAAILAVGVVWFVRAPKMPEIAWAPKAPRVVRTEIPSRASLAKNDRVVRAASRQVRGTAGVREIQTAATKQPPKLDVFPTPQPLSAQEQALVAFVKQAPPAVKKAVIEDQQHWDDPIIVADLQKPSPESESHQDQ